MSFLDSLKQDIQLYFATRGEFTDNRTGSFSNLTRPRNLGMFFCIDTKDELDQIRALVNQVRKMKTKVTALIFALGYEPIDLVTDKSILLFNLNDFSFFGKKKENLLEVFHNHHFELLLSFAFKDNIFCHKLVAEIKADFKIGPHVEGMEFLYDMTVLYKPDLFGIAGFYQNISHYLSVLNISRLGNVPTATEHL